MDFKDLDSMNQSIQEIYSLLNDLGGTDEMDSILADQLNHHIETISEIIQGELEKYTTVEG